MKTFALPSFPQRSTTPLEVNPQVPQERPHVSRRSEIEIHTPRELPLLRGQDQWAIRPRGKELDELPAPNRTLGTFPQASAAVAHYPQASGPMFGVSGGPAFGFGALPPAMIGASYHSQG